MTSSDLHDAFLLLSLPNCTLRTPTTTQTGILGLECVTLPPSAKATFNRDVFLLLKHNTAEYPLDPSRTVSLSTNNSGERVYVFHGTEADPLVITLIFSESLYSTGSLAEDVETFDSVLAQYLNLNRHVESGSKALEAAEPPKYQDQRGRLLLRDEDTGEIVGELDRKIIVHEDPILSQKGHEKDPVLIEIPEDAPLHSETAIEVFAQSVPPDQQDWMTRSASLVSHGITGGTNLLVNVINSASSYYISHSKPNTPLSSSQSTSFSENGPSGSGTPTPPPPPPSKVAVFLTSERTKKGLTTVHAISGQAVKVSNKTLAFVDQVIARFVAPKPKGPPLPPRQGMVYQSGSPIAGSSNSLGAPPPYVSSPDGKPPLPPRSPTGSRAPSPLPGQAGPPLPPRKLNTTARIVLSADLILTTLEESTKRIINISADRADAMVRHKHGNEVAQSTSAMAGSVKNIGLVYIDLQGIGRKAIVKRIAKSYVKTRVLHHNK